MKAALPLLAWALAAPVAPLRAQTPPPQPSFDCSRAANQVERTICADPALAREDAAMARLYAAARKGPLGNGQSAIGADQLVWLRERAGCEAPDKRAWASRAECLKDRYKLRNIDLATAALANDRAFALAQLQRLDPSSAVLVEALLRYADHPAGSNWRSAAMAADRQAIMALLAAPYARLQSESDQGYGKEILADSVKQLDDAFISDRTFAETLGILGAYAQGEQTPIAFPCAAIARNPALIDVESARFGSTIDNFVPRSDCASTWAPLPKLDALVGQIRKSWPPCEGTIRFSAYVSFNQSADAARLGIPRESGAKAPRLRALRGVPAASYAAVLAELTASYTVQRGFSAPDAATTARARLAEVLDGAHECGG